QGPGPHVQADAGEGEPQAEGLRLGRGMQSHQHALEPVQADRGDQREQEPGADQHRGDELGDAHRDSPGPSVAADPNPPRWSSAARLPRSGPLAASSSPGRPSPPSVLSPPPIPGSPSSSALRQSSTAPTP